MATRFIPITLAAVAVMAFSATAVLAGACYVDVAGADANDGSVDAPFKTIAHAVGRARAGDTVVVRPGVYDEAVTVAASGSKSKPVTITSAEKRKARVISFKVEADYVTIDGFEIVNEGEFGVDCGRYIEENTRKGCRIVNNLIREVVGTAIVAGEHAVVKGNLMKNVGRGVMVNSHSLVENNEIDVLKPRMVTKKGKTAPKKTQYAFFEGDHITFRGNYWHGAPEEYLKKGMGVDFFVTWDAWKFRPSSHILIENNRCFNATHACESETLRLKKSSDITFRNNLFVNTVYVGIYCKEFKNITVVNNTFINCGAYPVWFRSKRETDGAVVRNNLIAYYKHEKRGHGGPASDAGIRNDFANDPKATIESAHNMMWATNNRGYGETDFIAEPQFVNPDKGDFRLKAGSPGIDAGMTLEAVKTDMLGVKRPQGKAYDVGAWEFVSGATMAPTEE